MDCPVEQRRSSTRERLLAAAVDRIAELAAAPTMSALLEATAALVERARERDATVPLFLDAMREAERDPALRTRLAETLATYRQVVAGLVAGAPHPEALAILVVALGDGLLLHALVDPDLDVAGAVDALGHLVSGGAP